MGLKQIEEREEVELKHLTFPHWSTNIEKSKEGDNNKFN